MDGTLYDTEVIYRRAWLESGVPEEVYKLLIGRSTVNIEEILTEHGFDVAEVYPRKRAITDRYLEEGIPVKPGAVEALKWAREQGYRTCIATSSKLTTAQDYLKKTGMTGYFDKVLSGNELERGKPFPDVFLYALREMQATAEECVVVEDSFNGVRAGKAAGITTVMIPDAIPADDEMRRIADGILNSLHELPAWLTNRTKTNN